MKNVKDQKLESALTTFLTHLAGKNRSSLTVAAYRTDLTQFFTYLAENDSSATTVPLVTKRHVMDYMTYLGNTMCYTGVTQARKLAAIREFFRFFVAQEQLVKSPAETVEPPKKERKTRSRMRQDEYHQLLASAGSNHRDFAVLTVLLQCGLRVSELCALTLDDIDLQAGTLTVRDGKGQADREMYLEKKSRKALKMYLENRPKDAPSRVLFLNRYNEPIGRFGIRKLILRLCDEAGLEKKVSPHVFRHTFASYKAEQLVSPYMLRDLLGHKDIKTTMIYVHMSEEHKRQVTEATSL